MKDKPLFAKKIEEISSIFDDIVYSAIKSHQPDKIICSTYFSLVEQIRARKGSSFQISGLIEFLYFEYVKKVLQREFNISFKKIESEQTSFYFESKLNSIKIILTSDTKLERINEKYDLNFLDEFLEKKPDIFIGVLKNGKIISIGFFEIKVWIDAGDIKDNIIDRFSQLKRLHKKHQKNLPLLIYINTDSRDSPERAKYINEFLNLSDKCSFIRFIPKSSKNQEYYKDGEIRGSSIQGIMQEVIESIKKII